jgi:hypothetical protein
MSAGRFVLAKRTKTLSTPAQERDNSEADKPPHEQRGEVYMLVGRKDASLTDAERESDQHTWARSCATTNGADAMRGLARAHPELVA